MKDIKEEFDVLIPIWDKTDPFFTASLRGPGILIPLKHNQPWRVAPGDKKQPVHRQLKTRDCLSAVFPNAISVGAPIAGSLKYAAFIAPIIIFLSLLALGMGGFLIVNGYMILSVLMFLPGILVALLCAFFYRYWLCGPKDWPIIFNRKDRTITYTKPHGPSFFRFWELFVTQEFETRSWDDVKVRSYKYMETNLGASFHDNYNLTLIWGGNNGDPHDMADAVHIGYKGYFEDERLWMLWEHIRQYMEEGGLPIQPGDKLRQYTQGKPIQYPPEVIEAAGGPALTPDQIPPLQQTDGVRLD